MIVTEIPTNEQIENAVSTPDAMNAKSVDATELTKTTFFFELGFHSLGNERNAPGTEQDIKTTANKTLLKVKKRLFVSKEFKAIRSADARLKRRIDRMCVKGALLSVRTIPRFRAKSAFAMCVEHELIRAALVDKFAVVYPLLYNTAKTELGPLFKSDDYPKPEHVKDAFKFTYGFVTFDVPAALAEIDAVAYQKSVSQRNTIMKSAAEEINRTRRSIFAALLGKLQAELSPGETGTKKTFHKVAMTKLQKFVEEYDIMNVTNDAELAALKDQTAKLISGITVDNIKSSEDFKASLFTQITGIGDLLKPLVEEPGRALKIVN